MSVSFKHSIYSKNGGSLAALRMMFFAIAIAAFGAIAVLAYFSYQESLDPKHVYGRWLEMGTPGYDRASIQFNDSGVFRNNRMVATKFEFDGSLIHVKTGSGLHIYQLSYSKDAPLLRRIQPNSPTQRFVKQGYEHMVDMEGGGIAKKRRAALAQHFNDK
ncbi:hypothetical protein JCM19238_4992 [Vibrio ponticus]|uniref:DUF2850 domain-containing protein n=1 Tax=Vibrio rhodolitus TaxID=2231649 RepID=UPI0005006385|nr:DUF2850 domain-containing protein [Vibrio rhodolitus]GAK87382.1 hypothetical protein JCM19238_4992 [Vibrio ponticus]